MAAHPDVDVVVVAHGGRGRPRPDARRARAPARPSRSPTRKCSSWPAHIVTREAERGRGELRPVDSEHSAIWQCLWGEDIASVEKLILTASGGAFRDMPARDLERVTPREALRHPTWDMGRKITIDSATLMNKGFEAIEARWLFDVPMDRIEIVMHRESIVHSLVEFARRQRQGAARRAGHAPADPVRAQLPGARRRRRRAAAQPGARRRR